MNLKEQLFDCLPAGRYALAGLLRMLDIVETEAVPTAAVEREAQPRLLINPGFVMQHANTAEKLMMLVLHEIHHVLLGHTRRLPSETAADNFVFDCVINALLCRMFPQPEYTALFRDFYACDAFPACLLRPPENWDPSGRAALPPLALLEQHDNSAVITEVYAALYSRDGASYDEIRSLLPKISLAEDAIEGIPLLGDHHGSAQGRATPSSSALAQAVAAIVKHWPVPPEPLRGQSLDAMLRESRLHVWRPTGNRERLRRLIRKLAGVEEHGTMRRERPEVVRIESPVLAQDRRSIVLRALGQPPLLHHAEIAWSTTVPTGDRVHVYIDVSGSMDAAMAAVYGAVLDCERWVHPRIHLFSTTVDDISSGQLRAGYCRSTGGTDIECVAAHMAAARVKRALVLTDGYVGKPSPRSAATLQRVKLAVAYTPEHFVGHLGHFVKDSAVLEFSARSSR